MNEERCQNCTGGTEFQCTAKISAFRMGVEALKDFDQDVAASAASQLHKRAVRGLGEIGCTLSPEQIDQKIGIRIN